MKILWFSKVFSCEGLEWKIQKCSDQKNVLFANHIKITKAMWVSGIFKENEMSFWKEKKLDGCDTHVMEAWKHFDNGLTAYIEASISSYSFGSIFLLLLT